MELINRLLTRQIVLWQLLLAMLLVNIPFNCFYQYDKKQSRDWHSKESQEVEVLLDSLLIRQKQIHKSIDEWLTQDSIEKANRKDLNQDSLITKFNKRWKTKQN